MNQIWVTASIILFLLSRIGIPILITFCLSWGLRKLDARWRQEAAENQNMGQQERMKSTSPCWVMNDCPEESRKDCSAFNSPLTPCWDLFRGADGELSPNCETCHYREQVSISRSVMVTNA